MKTELKTKSVIWNWRPQATTGVFGTTTVALLATTDSFLTTTGNHWRPLTTTDDEER